MLLICLPPQPVAATKNWPTSVSRYLNLRSLFIQDLWFALTTWISKCKGKWCQCNHKTVTITGSTIKWLKTGCLLLIRNPQGPKPTSKKSPIFDSYPHSKINNVKDQTTSFLPLGFWLTTLMLWPLWRMFASFTSPISTLMRCLRRQKRWVLRLIPINHYWSLQLLAYSNIKSHAYQRKYYFQLAGLIKSTQWNCNKPL